MPGISDGLPYYGMDEDHPDEPDAYYWHADVQMKKFNTDLVKALGVKNQEDEDEEAKYNKAKKDSGLTEETVDKWQELQEAQLREQQRLKNYNEWNATCQWIYIYSLYPRPDTYGYNACVARNPYT